MKFHRNVPAMVLFRIFLKEFDSVKNCGCHGNKTEKFLKTVNTVFSKDLYCRNVKTRACRERVKTIQSGDKDP